MPQTDTADRLLAIELLQAVMVLRTLVYPRDCWCGKTVVELKRDGDLHMPECEKIQDLVKKAQYLDDDIYAKLGPSKTGHG